MRAWEGIRQFAQAFFIPVFSALVGVRLDLVPELDIPFFLRFLLPACGVKTLSVWGAARPAGEDSAFSGCLALAMNARGTLGVILVGATRKAGIINAEFFVVLVLVSVVTSQTAGFWLTGRASALKDAPAPAPAPAPTPLPAAPHGH
ncbi:cation:proton antiporter [Streptomyces sp. NPDC058092]|uniref:cation:proton antiporter domain-containing protein n=1 Tax=Streptomyces sp. NPDC058092 TaxID=3346336 RepID=UPI0036F06386